MPTPKYAYIEYWVPGHIGGTDLDDKRHAGSFPKTPGFKQCMCFLSFCLDISVSWTIFGVFKINWRAGQTPNKNLTGSVTKFGV